MTANFLFTGDPNGPIPFDSPCAIQAIFIIPRDWSHYDGHYALQFQGALGTHRRDLPLSTVRQEEELGGTHAARHVLHHILFAGVYHRVVEN